MSYQEHDLKPELSLSAAKVVRRLRLTIEVSVVNQTDLNVGPMLNDQSSSQKEWVGVCENSCSHTSNVSYGEENIAIGYDVLAFRAGELDSTVSLEVLNPLKAGLLKYQQDHPSDRLQRWFDFGIKPTKEGSNASLILLAKVYLITPKPYNVLASSYDYVAYIATQVRGPCFEWELFPGETLFYEALDTINRSFGPDNQIRSGLWFDKDIWFLNKKPDQKGVYHS